MFCFKAPLQKSMQLRVVDIETGFRKTNMNKADKSILYGNKSGLLLYFYK